MDTAKTKMVFNRLTGLYKWMGMEGSELQSNRENKGNIKTERKRKRERESRRHLVMSLWFFLKRICLKILVLTSVWDCLLKGFSFKLLLIQTHYTKDLDGLKLGTFSRSMLEYQLSWSFSGTKNKNKRDYKIPQKTTLFEMLHIFNACHKVFFWFYEIQ